MSVHRGHPTIAIKDQTITVSKTSRCEFCCSRLATGLTVREKVFFLYLSQQLNGGLKLERFAKWISSSPTRLQRAIEFNNRHQIMMDTILLFCFQSSRRLAENPEKFTLLTAIFHISFGSTACHLLDDWIDLVSYLTLFPFMIHFLFGPERLLESINWNW